MGPAGIGSPASVTDAAVGAAAVDDACATNCARRGSSGAGSVGEGLAEAAGGATPSWPPAAEAWLGEVAAPPVAVGCVPAFVCDDPLACGEEAPLCGLADDWVGAAPALLAAGCGALAVWLASAGLVGAKELGDPAAPLGEASLDEGDEAAGVGVTGACGPSCDIKAANAPLKPSGLALGCGAAVASPGTAGLAVETWAEAASMAPCGWIVGSGAYCAWGFGPLKQPSRHRRLNCLSIEKISLISGEGVAAIGRARLKLPGPDRQGRPV